MSDGKGGSPGGSRPTLGRAAAWSRDLAIVGASTSFLSIFALDWRVHTSVVVAALVGGVVGALFGIVLRHLLLAWLNRPIVAWIPISLVLGAVLGGTIGVVTSLVVGVPEGAIFRIGYRTSGLFGAIAGALQLSWFWLPYAVRAGRGKSTWPIVAAAVVIGGAIGYAALYLLIAIIHPHVD